MQPGQKTSDELWRCLAEGVTDETEVTSFFYSRMAKSGLVHSRTRIVAANKLVNEQALRRFASSATFDANALQAHAIRGDTLLFHGCPERAGLNIMAEGLLLSKAQSGRLGQGLYGAPDPRKSIPYCRDSPSGKFLFVCRFNLAQPARHTKADLDEFCVYDESRVVVLWSLKLSDT